MSDARSPTVNEMREFASVAVIATLFPHIALLKTLLKKGVLSHGNYPPPFFGAQIGLRRPISGPPCQGVQSLNPCAHGSH